MDVRSRFLFLIACVALVSTATAAPPTLTNINTLAGENEDTPTTIEYSDLAAAANESDADGDTIEFRFEAGSSGLLLQSPGGAPVTAGDTLGSGDSWTWYPSGDDNGTINAFTVRARAGGQNSTGAVTVSIAVPSVNDAPSFTIGGTVNVNEDDAPYSGSIASSISPGPANESDQSDDLVFEITDNTDPGLFSSGPTVSASGQLSFTLTEHANGSADIDIRLNDQGGTDRGGVERSATQTFTIDVAAQPDDPEIAGDLTGTAAAPLSDALVDDTGNTESFFIFEQLTVEDPDHNSPSAETVDLTVRVPEASQLYGTLALPGFASSVSGGVTIYTRNGLSPPDAQSALRAATFEPLNNAQPVGIYEVGITIEATDSTARDADDFSESLFIESVNDAPEVSASLAVASVADGQEAKPFRVAINDPDPGEIFSVTVRETSSPALGTLTLPSDPFVGDAAAVSNTIRNVAYRPDPVTATTSAQFEVVVTDIHPDTSTGAPVTATVSLGIAFTNDPPAFAGLATDIIRITDNPSEPSYPFGTASILDLDGAQNLTVTLSLDDPAKGGFVSPDLTNNQLTGTASQVTEQLRNVIFSPAPNRLPLGESETVTITISVNDGYVTRSNSDTEVEVTSVDGAPEIFWDLAGGPGGGTVSGDFPLPEDPAQIEPAPVALPFEKVSFVDTGELEITLTIDDADKGVLENLGGFVETPAGSGSFRFVGDAAAATAAIQAIEYAPSESFLFPVGQPGRTDFTITASDDVLNLATRLLPVVLINDARNFLVTSRVDDPALPGTLRHAISIAENNDVITFALPEYPATLRLNPLHGPLVVERHLKFRGPGSDMLTISGDANVNDTTDPGDVQLFRVFASVEMRGLRLVRGFADTGGAVYVGRRDPAVAAGSLRLIDCVIRDCVATQFGGAVDVVEGSLEVERCLFENNSLDPASGLGGGAVSLYTSADCAFTNSTFSGNVQGASTGFGGGAIYVENHSPTTFFQTHVTHCTFADNVDASFGGSSILGNVSNTRVLLSNSIFADFSSRNLQSLGGSEFVSTGGNFSNDNTSSTYLVGGVPQLVTLLNQPSDRVNVDPRLGGIERLEGHTRGHRLLPDSPAIGGAVAGVSVVDQRGVIRSGGADSGAVDFDALGKLIVNEIYVTPNPADPNFIEFYNPRDQQAIDLSGMELWIDGILRHRFAPRVIRPGFGIVVSDVMMSMPGNPTPVVMPSEPLALAGGGSSPDLELTVRSTLELRIPASGGSRTVESVSYVAIFGNPALPDLNLDYDTNSITLAPQFGGAAFAPHSVVQLPPSGGVILGAPGNKVSPGADTGLTPFGKPNAFPAAFPDRFEITEDEMPRLDVLANDLDADGSDELIIVDVNIALSPSSPPAGSKSSVWSQGGASVSVTPAGNPLRGEAIEYDPRLAYNSLPEGARVTDSFAYTVIDIGGGAVTSINDAGTVAGAPSIEIGAPAHRMQIGDTITIRGSSGYDGDHVINSATADAFTVPFTFNGDPGPLQRGNWRAELTRLATGIPSNPSSARSEELVEVTILGRNDPPAPTGNMVATTEERALRIFGDPDHASGIALDTDGLYPAPLAYAGLGVLADDTDPDTDDQPFTRLRLVGVCQAAPVVDYAVSASGGLVEVETGEHGLQTGDTILISGYGGHPSYNGYHEVTVISPTRFTLPIGYLDNAPVKGMWTVLTDDNRLSTTSLDGAEVRLELRADRANTNIVYNPTTSDFLNGLAEGELENDSFYYAVEDSHGAVSLAQVSVTVTGVNDAPTPGDDPPGLAAADALTSSGTLEDLLGGVTVAYVLPVPGNGERVTAAAVPEGGDPAAPVLLEGMPFTHEDAAIDLLRTELIANDGEIDRLDMLSIEIGAGQSLSRLGAAVAVSADGSRVKYDPTSAPGLQALAREERRIDTFEITITDGLAPVVSLVAVVVEGRNDQPTAAPAAYATTEKQLLEVVPPGLIQSGFEIDQNRSTPDNRRFLLPVVDAPTTVFEGRVDVSLAVQTGSINDFLDGGGSTVAVSPGHGLNSGVEVTLVDSGPLDGLYQVTVLDADRFSLPIAYEPDFGSQIGVGWSSLGSTFAYDPRDSIFPVFPGSGPAFTLQGLAEGQSYADTFTYTLLDGSGLFANDDVFRVEADRSSIELQVLINDASLDGVASEFGIVEIGSPSAGGSVALNGDQSLIYTPQTGFVGDEVFTYTIEDDLGNRDSARVTVRVTIDRLNGNLRANDDRFTVALGQSPLLEVLANDNITPATGDPLELVSVMSPGDQGGVIVVEGDALRYTPAAGFVGEEIFSYTMSGGGSATADAEVTVLVVDRTNTLNVRDDTFGVPVGGSLISLNVLENDNVLPSTGEELLIDAVGVPTHGSVEIINEAALAYTPAAGFVGTDSFTYTAVDGFGGTGTATVTVQVGYVTTNTDIFSVPFDDPGETSDDGASQLDVLANDGVLGAGSGQLTIIDVEAADPAFGVMDVTAGGGSLSFDPAESATGQADFIYTVMDSGSRTATGTVTVVVLADGVRASSDFFTVQSDSTANELGVLANDLRLSDLPGELSISGIGTGPNAPDKGGTVEISEDFKQLVYTPAGGFEGVESFTYTLTDGESSDTALVSVRSSAGEMIAGEDAFFVFRGSENNRLGVLLNDRVIPDGGQLLSITATGLDPGNAMNPTARGTLEIIEDGAALQYTPSPLNTGFPYEETFTYEISSGGTARAEAVIRLTVLDRGGARDLETNHDVFAVLSDTGGTLLDVLANDSVLPASAEDWVITEVTPPTANVCSVFLTTDFPDPVALAARLAGQGDPVSQFLWAGFSAGSRATLSGGDEVALRAALVTGFNAAATSGGSIYDPARFAGVALRAETQQLIDDGATGEQLIVLNRLLLEDALGALVTPATGAGAVQIVGTDLLYAPQPGFVGAVRFTYRVSDGLGGTGSAEVIVRVGDISVSEDRFSAIAGGGPVALDVTANDGVLRAAFPDTPDPAQADFRLSAVRAVDVDPASAGTAEVGGETVSFEPAAGFSGEAVLTYWVEDDAGCEFPGTAVVDVLPIDDDRARNVVTVTVHGVNDPPQLLGAVAGGTDDESSIHPFGGATLIEYDDQRSQLVTVTLTYPAAHGTVSGDFVEIAPGVLRATGTEAELTAALRGLVFTPFNNRIPVGTTEDSLFSVSMDDGDTAAPVVVDTAVMEVTPVPDAPEITGTVAGQLVYQHDTLRPFVGVNITDVDDLGVQQQTVTVVIDDAAKGIFSNLGGFIEQPADSGRYVVSGTPSAASAALRGLVFDPTPGNRITPQSPEIATLTVSIDDGFVPTVIDATTTVDIRHAEIDRLLALDGAGADDSEAAAGYGSAVDVRGDTLVVGSPLRDGAGENAGAAFVYERTSGFGAPWGQVAELSAADGAADDEFGCAVVVDGEFIAVGARREDEAAANSGAVYLFHRDPTDPTNWTQVAKLLPPTNNLFGADAFGSSLALQGDTLLVGTPQANIPGFRRAGRVFVFRRGPGGPGDWGHVQTLEPTGGSPTGFVEDEGRFGESVALDGDTAVVGAPGLNRATNSGDWNLGAAFVFERLDVFSPWAETTRLDEFGDPSVGAFAGFGYDVDVSGDRIVVGVHWEGLGFRASHPDSVKIYERDALAASGWSVVREIRPADGPLSNHFGTSVAISGDHVLIGSPGPSDGSASMRGFVEVFRRDAEATPAWNRIDRLEPGAIGAEDEFGRAVAIDGFIGATGAAKDSVNTLGADSAGSVRVHRFRYELGPRPAVPIPDALAQEGVPFEMTVDPASFGDPLYPGELTVAVQLAGGGSLPVGGWLSFEPSLGRFFGTPQPGNNANYELVLVATNPLGSTAVSASFAIEVELDVAGELEQAYAAWAATQFTPSVLGNSVLENSVWGMDADPDGDGPNLLDMIFNGAAYLPQPSPLEIEPGTAQTTLRFPVNPDVPVEALHVEWSTGLVAWTDAGVVIGDPLELAAGEWWVTVIISHPASLDRLFARLRVGP